jgi:hypothetical protein
MKNFLGEAIGDVGEAIGDVVENLHFPGNKGTLLKTYTFHESEVKRVLQCRGRHV